MPAIVWTVLRLAWPFILAGAIWGVQEARLATCRLSLAASLKRETQVQSLLDAARQRATDLALLYAGMLPKIDAAARAQEAVDRERIASLEDRVESLSRAPTLHFSAGAVGVWGDAAAAANGGDARASQAPAGGTEAVPPAAASLSEHDVIAFVTDASEAYLDAVSKFHECRDLYNAARNAQINASKGTQ